MVSLILQSYSTFTYTQRKQYDMKYILSVLEKNAITRVKLQSYFAYFILQYYHIQASLSINYLIRMQVVDYSVLCIAIL